VKSGKITRLTFTHLNKSCSLSRPFLGQKARQNHQYGGNVRLSFGRLRWTKIQNTNEKFRCKFFLAGNWYRSESGQQTYWNCIRSLALIYSLAWPATYRLVSSYSGKCPSLFRFISCHSGLIRCRSTMTAYAIEWNIISPQKPDPIILNFMYLDCVWQVSFYCLSNCRCSRRHFKLCRTFSINWTVDFSLKVVQGCENCRL